MGKLVVAMAAFTAFVPAWSAAQAAADPPAAGAQAPPPAAMEAAPAPLAAPAQAPAPAPLAAEGPASAPAPLAAEGPASAAIPRSYLLARIGALVPRAANVDGFSTGVAAEAGAGTRLTGYLAVEVATGYLRMSQDETGSNTSVGDYRLTQDLSAVPIVASVRLFGRARGFEAYAVAGAGVYLWSLAGKVSSNLYAPYSYSSTDTGFGLDVGAGLSASLSRRFALGIEAKYLFAQGTFSGHTSNLDSAIVTTSLGYGF